MGALAWCSAEARLLDQLEKQAAVTLPTSFLLSTLHAAKKGSDLIRITDSEEESVQAMDLHKEQNVASLMSVAFRPLFTTAHTNLRL